MKNIHVLPTENSTRASIKDGILILHRLQWRKDTQNIYITNSEEIKEGDWVYNRKLKIVVKAKRAGRSGENDWYKIILTTDQELIKDGVQAIDDEFLEWFVKNPSCEEVEVEEINNKWHKEDGNVVSVSVYKIILPKEKLGGIPKGTINMVIGKPKQETLEEASLLSRPIHLIWDEGERYDCNEKFREEFKNGAKWQQERSYSEEDMKLAFETGRNFQLTGENNFVELIEKLKKK